MDRRADSLPFLEVLMSEWEARVRHRVGENFIANRFSSCAQMLDMVCQQEARGDMGQNVIQADIGFGFTTALEELAVLYREKRQNKILVLSINEAGGLRLVDGGDIMTPARCRMVVLDNAGKESSLGTEELAWFGQFLLGGGRVVRIYPDTIKLSQSFRAHRLTMYREPR